MKKYDNYKDSEIKWLGEIPEHWGHSRLKLHSISKTGTTPSRDNDEYWVNGNIPWMSSGEINQRIIKKVNSFVTEKAYSKTSLTLYPKGSLVIAMNGQGKTKGMVGILDIETTFNQSITAFKFNEDVSCKYIYYFIDSKYFDLRGLVGEDREGLSSAILKNMCFPLPPIQEQVTIFNYLDQKTSQLDQLINQKQRFIELLQEERTAVINQAVTKGLDPKVKMKDSGIEWLGEIPEHWEVKKIKYICDLINIRATEKPDYVLALENITNWTGEIIGNPFENKMEGDATLFETNDILFNKLRPYLAKVVKTDREGGCVGELLVLRAKDNISPDYLYNRLSSEMIITIVDNSTYGSKMPRASWDKFISNIYVGVPPNLEQLEIANYVKGKVSEIMLLQEKSKQEIELLKEYRTALISEVVTGKVDVRNVVLN
jgi:restriction endonuclease S subunit